MPPRPPERRPKSNPTVLVGVSLLFTLVIAGIGYLIYSMLHKAPAAPAPVAASTPSTATGAGAPEGAEGSCTEDSQCEEAKGSGWVCLEGECAALTPPDVEESETRKCKFGEELSADCDCTGAGRAACGGLCRKKGECAQFGEACATEKQCVAPLECCPGAGNVCLTTMKCREAGPATDATADPEICSSADVKEALNFLVAACEKRGGKDLGACGPSEWKEFAIENDRFDSVMCSFPDQVTLHFERRTPPVDGAESWTAKYKGVYLQQLRKHKSTFAAAKLIFVIGRASPGGSDEMNQKLAFMRMNFASQLLRELFADADMAERDALDKKLKSFGLGEQKQLELGFFRKSVAADRVLWSDSANERLDAVMSDDVPLDGAKRKWVANTINQVVFLVPVPCTAGKAH